MCCWHELLNVLSGHARWSWGHSSSDHPIARQHTGQLISTTYHHPWLIQSMTWCWQLWCMDTNILFISAYTNHIKAWIESNHSLRCHVTTWSWWQVSLSPPHQVMLVCMPLFCRRQSVLIELHQTHVTSVLGDKVIDYVVCLKSEFLWHTDSTKKGKFYTIMIYPYLNRSVCLSVGSLTWWRFRLYLSRSSLMSCSHDAPLVHEIQMWSHPCKQWDSHWFQGCKMHLCGIWSTLLWIHFLIYSVQLICTTAISLESPCMLFTTLGWLPSLPVDYSWQPVALK